MRILLIGYGKMGKTIENIALQKGHQIAGIIDLDNRETLSAYTGANTDVAIEFTHPESAPANIRYCLENDIPVVCGSTGWLEKLPEIKALCQEKNGAFFYASNYSVGVNLFFHFNEYIASRMQAYSHFQVEVKEVHHTQKADKPSGTAITTAEGILAHYTGKQQWVSDAEHPAGQELEGRGGIFQPFLQPLPLRRAEQRRLRRIGMGWPCAGEPAGINHEDFHRSIAE